MKPRDFLIRGLLAGLLAGIATFFTAYLTGEPQVETAISIEESHEEAADPAGTPVPAADGGDDQGEEAGTHSHGQGEEAGHSHGDEEGTVVSRHNQRTWGLLTGTITMGAALGGIVSLVAAGVVGRIGRLTPGQSTALMTLLGYVSFALIPFMKYPATPPAVGNADTIGSRTSLYMTFLVVSVVAAIAATYGAVRLRELIGTFWAVVAAVAGYLAVVLIVGQLMPPVNEIGDFPADTLWYFRQASLATQATMWAIIGIALTALVSRMYRQDAPPQTTQRRHTVGTR